MKEQENTLRFFRIKTEWIAEAENGSLGKTKTEELVMAANYSDAEKTAYAIAEEQERYKFGGVNIEIIKTKIDDVVFNNVLKQDEALLNGLVCNYFEEDSESGVGLYAVKTLVFTVDEKTAKTKSTAVTLYIPADSNSDAVSRAKLQMSEHDYVVRDVKFDNAAAIYWPTDIHQSKVRALDLNS